MSLPGSRQANRLTYLVVTLFLAAIEISSLSAQTQPAAAAKRNENVQVNRIDTDALKESNIRLGDSVTIVSQPLVEAGYFATEHGRPPGDQVTLRAVPLLSGWHGELFESHQNAVFNARTFFQAGSVLPSHQNNYRGRFAGKVKGLGTLSGRAGQRKIRGMVNGNVLVPLATERTPLATDPAIRSEISRFLAGYPTASPNRTDFDPRALNTNSPQTIDEIDASLRLDREAVAGGRLILSHGIARQRIQAFQLVAGQNPDTEVHSVNSRITYLRALTPRMDLSVGAAFSRVKSVLRSEPNAVGPRVRIGFQIEELGPDSQFPIDRAQNTYRWGAVVSRRMAGGRHTLTFGGDGTRFQLNGIETNNQRGNFVFSNNFGRSALDNFRFGTPSTYEVTIGEVARGFRNWQANFFLADQWKAGSRLQLYYGLRYNLETAPREVDGLNQIPYGCDCNNLSPRFSIAYRLKAEWVLRTSYTISFGQIFPVTYQQIRFNLPQVRYLQVQNPSLLDPLRGINLSDPGVRSSATLLAPNMVAPYSHQYNLSFERRLRKDYTVRMGYIGSRTIKLLNSYVENRAVPKAGVPLTIDTVDQRRADPRYYDVNRVLNAGIAYLDAAQVSLDSLQRAGLAWGATYTFAKAIDEGPDFTSTAANRDLNRNRNQSQDNSLGDRKGLSNFDSTHSLLLRFSYEIPTVLRGLSRWTLSGAGLMKSGTPLTLYVGSDSPGFGNIDGGPSDRPHIADPSILGLTVGNPNTAPLILRRDRFSYIAPGESRGNLGRGTFRKGGIANFNAAASRQWRFGGKTERSLLFRAEAANLTNHPQFDEPQRNLTSPAFGRITNTLNDGRVLQLSIRILL
ncbi:MAG: hypothetical protein ABIZ80_08035 [Bryobacteraceae bacterium]